MRERYIILKKYKLDAFFSVENYTGVLYLNEKTEFDNFNFSMLSNLTVAH